MNILVTTSSTVSVRCISTPSDDEDGLDGCILETTVGSVRSKKVDDGDGDGGDGGDGSDDDK